MTIDLCHNQDLAIILFFDAEVPASLRFSAQPQLVRNVKHRVLRVRAVRPSLERGNFVPYEALSYAWGSNDLSESTTVNDKMLSVTKSLFHALSHLRHDQHGMLWVDAVCIDQGNIVERVHQLHRDISRHKSQEDLSRVQEEWLSIQQYLVIDRTALVDLQREGLIALLEEPWFTRIWILREVSDARAALVCCGRWTVPAHMLAGAATLIGVDLSPQCKAILDLVPNPLILRSAKTKRDGGKQTNRKLWKLLFRRASGSIQVMQGGFAEMAAFSDAKQIRMVIECQRQVYFITSMVAFIISMNERHRRDITTMLLTWKDDWVQVTKDGLLTILNVKVIGVGTNPSDPEASWVSTVNFDEEPSICRKEAEKLRQRLRESWEGVIEPEVVYIDKSSIMSKS
ncbi:HET domain containing protein [Colletotrichum incanum]|nr:HET domain containing protein [Colletotrichum incanum]